MTKTSKSERKYGKKEDTEKPKRVRKQKDTEVIIEDMYKILVDGSGFTRSMTYEDCQKLISKYETDAKRMNRMQPSLVLVKQ